MKTGAFHTGLYPNYLAEAGVSDEAAREKVNSAFQTIFSIRKRVSAIIRMKTRGAWWIPETSTHGPKA